MLLRISLLSLALGTGLALAGLVLLSPAPDSIDLPTLEWDTDQIESYRSYELLEGDKLRRFFKLPPPERIILPLNHIDADSYPFLHLELGDFPKDLGIRISWSKPGEAYPSFSHQLISEPRLSQWIATREMENWHGEINELYVTFPSSRGEPTSINKIGLHPASLKTELFTLWSDWTSFRPWRRSSINSNLGVTKLSPIYPTLAIACIFLLSVAAYWMLHFFLPRKEKFSWAAIGLVFLFCWLVLDSLWQYKLLRQAGETSRIFSGKSSEEKLLAGPDAALFELAREAKHLIPEDQARVFIVSSDDYIGLRSAYYMYPHNVYFMLRGAELPWPIYLKEGDYVLVVRPSEIELHHRRDELVSKRIRRPVEVLLRKRRGSLVRLTQ